MTRFSISMEQAIEMAMWALQNLDNGQILIPKIPSYRIIDLANIFENCKKKIVGIRQGEKLHEDLITSAESEYAVETKKYFILYPNSTNKKISNLQKNLRQKEYQKDLLITVEQIRIF